MIKSFKCKFNSGDLFVHNRDLDIVYEVLYISDTSIKFTDQFTCFEIDFSVKEQVDWLEDCEYYYDII